jgi:DNA polymerase-3 subunit beta
MELLQVDRNVLLAPLQAVSGVVERRHTLPILSNVLLEIGAGKLSVTATDLEIQVASETESSDTTPVQATTVSARKLQDSNGSRKHQTINRAAGVRTLAPPCRTRRR